MKTPTLYSTPEQVEAFVYLHFHQTGQRLLFPEALAKMKSLGLLSSLQSPIPAFSGSQDRKSFSKAFDTMPFNAGVILHNAHTYLTKGIVEEEALFPVGKDVYCIKHLPYMNEEAHTHTYFEITYIYSGKCTMLFGGEMIDMSEGDLCIVPPGSPHAQPLKTGCFAIGLMVRRSTFDALFGELLIKNDLASQFFRDSLYDSNRANFLRLYTDPSNEQLRWYLQTLAGECYRTDPHSNTCAISLVKLFLAEAFRMYGGTATVYREAGQVRKLDCGLILQYIQNNYRSVTLHELSDVFHYNEAYLSRLLHDYTHQSFTEIVRSLRLKRAEDYLLNSDLKIHEINRLVGYDSVDHFSRTFKAAYGCSPVAYRKKHREQRE